MILEKLKWKNFLSYGKKMTELKLDLNKTINVQGLNGHGKSVFLDVLHYALTSKPFRKIKMSEIPNSINKKKCYVELHVRQSNKKIIIKRGINPKIFEIWIDGSLLNEDSKSIDQQKFLEQLLHFNSKTLRYTIIMSSMNYSPFLKMTVAEKRLFIDDILNISDFTDLSNFTKKKFSIFKTKITDLEFEIKSLDDKIKQIEDQNSKVIQNSDDQINLIQQKIDKLKGGIEELEKIDFSKIEDLSKQLDIFYQERDEKINTINLSHQSEVSEIKNKYQNLINEIKLKYQKILDEEENTYQIKLKKYNDRQNNQNTHLQTLNEKLSILNEEYHQNSKKLNISLSLVEKDINIEEKHKQFIRDNSECPKCRGQIDEKFKKKAYYDIQHILTPLVKKKNLILNEIEDLQEIKQSIIKLKDEIEEYNQKIKDFNSKLTNFKLKYTDHKNKIINKKQSEINELLSQQNEDEKKSINKTTIKTDNIKEEYNDKIQYLKDEITKLTSIRDNNKSNIIDKKGLIGDYQDQISRLKNPEISAVVDTAEFLHKLNNDRKKLEEYNNRKRIFEISIKLLSDKGFKTFIVDKYIPVLNKYVNEYLDILEAHYRLKFDAQLNETIVARGYEKLSYESFSSGEKARCDLALLFAFIELSKKKNSIDSNLLILDEVADNSLDKNGVYGVLNIISRLKTKGYTVYVISHRDEMKDEFDMTLNATKKVFSKMEEV